MMISVIWAHPNENSLTALIRANTCKALVAAGKSVVTTDLYRMAGGNPFPGILGNVELQQKTSLDPIVQEQMRMLEKAEGFVVIHPDWWGGPPAVLKGWIDRVFRPGTAYELPEGFSMRKAQGLLTDKKAVVIICGDAKSAGLFEDFWIQSVWGFCGVEARLYYLGYMREITKIERLKMVEDAVAKTVEFLK